MSKNNTKVYDRHILVTNNRRYYDRRILDNTSYNATNLTGATDLFSANPKTSSEQKNLSSFIILTNHSTVLLQQVATQCKYLSNDGMLEANNKRQNKIYYRDSLSENFENITKNMFRVFIKDCSSRRIV